MHQPDAAGHRLREQVPHPLDVDPPRQLRGQFALPERAVAGAIQHRGELLFREEPCQGHAVFGVAGQNARPLEPEVFGLTDADDPAGILRGEVGHGVVARHAGYAGNQQRQRYFRGRRGKHHGDTEDTEAADVQFPICSRVLRILYYRAEGTHCQCPPCSGSGSVGDHRFMARYSSTIRYKVGRMAMASGNPMRLKHRRVIKITANTEPRGLPANSIRYAFITSSQSYRSVLTSLMRIHQAFPRRSPGYLPAPPASLTENSTDAWPVFRHMRSSIESRSVYLPGVSCFGRRRW